jgi:GNAT superfamily N-acetyltransferase
MRAARPGDARAVAEVHVGSWQWAYRGQLPDDYLDGLSVEERRSMWTQRLADPDPGVLVAVDDEGTTIGFVSVGPSRDDDANPGTGELEAIYLVLKAAGTGTGRLLLEAAEALMRDAGYTRATLWVLETNQRARRFYERAGWAFDGSRSDHQFQCLNRPIVRYAASL